VYLLGFGIGEALDLIGLESSHGAVFGVEEPCPYREMPWHCFTVNTWAEKLAVKG
jgi:hypothetical protein